MLLLRSSVTFSFLFLLLAIVDDTLAFSSSQLIRSSASSSTSSSSTLNVGVVWTDDVDNDMYLMNRAEACANSDSCGLDEATAFLDDILHQQKECIGAGVLSTKATICDNVDVTAEIVANLREKIEIQRRQVAPVKAAVHVFNVMLGVYVISTIMHGVAAVPNVPVDSPLYTDFLSSSLMEEASSTRGVTPFLPQEFFWAARDGYLPSLMTEFFKNGGLVVDTSAFDTKVVAFTPQEWVWSIQNGSFGNILQENMKYGGLVVDSSYESDVTPMTLQDVVWSIQGGYAGTAAQHFFRNGGV
jgi:hypothetical protein